MLKHDKQEMLCCQQLSYLLQEHIVAIVQAATMAVTALPILSIFVGDLPVLRSYNRRETVKADK
jgi:hypothetical protein